MRRFWFALWGAAALMGCSGGSEPSGKGGSAPEAAAGAFAAIEAEILVPNCARPGCHAGERATGGLDLSRGKAYADLVGVPANRRPDRLQVKPGDPENSYLVQRLVPGGDTPLMPLGARPLPEADIERIRAWIRDGAKK